MAKPIEATPVLLGKSARRFDKLMANVKFHPIRSRKIDWDEFDRLLEVKRSRSIETTKKKE